MKGAMLIFTKNAVAGKVKTRLAKTIGPERALAVYRSLLRHTKAVTEDLPMDKWVFYADFIAADDLWTDSQYAKRLQQGRDLGERMKRAFCEVFEQEYEKAVIIGTDCPQISERILLAAFDKLEQADVVIGPAHDGGYYLLGLRQVHESLFEGIHWSTADVLPETIRRCRQADLRVELLETLHDIDEEADLEATGYALWEEAVTKKEGL